MERVVTIGGECMFESGNLWIRLGTSFHDALKYCKGLLREPRKLLMGGPMSGRTQNSQQVPVTFAATAILALPKEIAVAERAEPCIRCGLCVDVCPENLIPETIVRAVRKGHKTLAQEYNIDACTECGLCAYICPSKIPLVSIIRDGKSHPVKERVSEPVHVLSSHG